MAFFPDAKTMVEFGPFSITWYAFFIMTGALIAFSISKYNLKKVGYKSDDIDDLFIGSLAFGFLGARLWFVLFSSNLGYYFANPLSIIAIWEGGLAIQGGLIAGAVFAYFFAKKRRINFIQAADLVVPNILIAQALGRWGNFINQEAFGEAVSYDFISKFPKFIQEGMFIGGQYYHPTFLYESVANIIGWILIVVVLKRLNRIRRGDLSYAYLMWYGVTRFFIEGLRTDSLYFMGLRMAQLTSIAFVIVGLLGYFGFFRKTITKDRKPIILWDFDGTLGNTQDLILATFKQVFKEMKPNLELSHETYLSFLGPTLDDSFARYFEGEDVDKAITRYRTLNLELHEQYIEPMDGAHEILENLHKQGYRMGLVSSKQTQALMVGVEMLKMKDYFEVILGYDLYDKVKPEPDGLDKALEMMGADKGGVLYIGDTATDIEAGRRAGSFTIGYVFDKMREQDLRDSKPNVVINDLREIEAILKEDHEWTITMM